MSSKYSGACLCGTVKVTVAAGPVAVLSCFCNHCKKGAGAPSQLIAKFLLETVHIDGSDSSFGRYIFTDTSSGAPKEKVFCNICGTPLWTIPAAAKGKYLMIRTTLLDTGATLRPQSEIFVKNRPDWMRPAENATQFEEARG